MIIFIVKYSLNGTYKWEKEMKLEIIMLPVWYVIKLPKLAYVIHDQLEYIAIMLKYLVRERMNN